MKPESHYNWLDKHLLGFLEAMGIVLDVRNLRKRSDIAPTLWGLATLKAGILMWILIYNFLLRLGVV